MSRCGDIIEPGHMKFHLLDPETNDYDQKVNEHIVLHDEFMGQKKAELFKNDAKGSSQVVKEGTWEGAAGGSPYDAMSIQWSVGGGEVEQITFPRRAVMVYQGKNYYMTSSAGPAKLR